MPRDAHNASTAHRLDPSAPAVLYVELRAPIDDAARLEGNVAAFCAVHSNAAVYAVMTTGRNHNAGRVVVYLVINGGTVRGALRGDPEARRAGRTFAAVVAELHMFDPVLVARPDVVRDSGAGPEEHHERRA